MEAILREITNQWWDRIDDEIRRRVADAPGQGFGSSDRSAVMYSVACDMVREAVFRHSEANQAPMRESIEAFLEVVEGTVLKDWVADRGPGYYRVDLDREFKFYDLDKPWSL